MLALLLRLWLLAQATNAPPAYIFAAVQAETSQISAELLLAQSWYESRWTHDGVSRIELQSGGSSARRGGTWKKKFPPYFKGPYFCGPSQLKRKSESACRELGLNITQNYREAREHIQTWLKYSHGDLSKALAGYGGGTKYANSKPNNNRPWRYSRKVQRLANSYKKRINRLLDGVDRVY